MKYYKVEGNTNLVRDGETKAIVNTNQNEYKKYVSERLIKEKENLKIQNIESDLDRMKSDIEEIKNLLRRLVNGNES